MRPLEPEEPRPLRTGRIGGEPQEIPELFIINLSHARAADVAAAEAIGLGTPPRAPPDGNGSMTYPSGAARRELMNALEENDWHAARTATALGIGRSTLFRRLKMLRISLRERSAESH